MKEHDYVITQNNKGIRNNWKQTLILYLHHNTVKPVKIGQLHWVCIAFLRPVHILNHREKISWSRWCPYFRLYCKTDQKQTTSRHQLQLVKQMSIFYRLYCKTDQKQTTSRTRWQSVWHARRCTGWRTRGHQFGWSVRLHVFLPFILSLLCAGRSIIQESDLGQSRLEGSVFSCLKWNKNPKFNKNVTFQHGDNQVIKKTKNDNNNDDEQK